MLRCDIFDENVTKDGIDDFKDSDFDDIDDGPRIEIKEEANELKKQKNENKNGELESDDEDITLEDEDEEIGDEGSISEGELKQTLERDEEVFSDNEVHLQYAMFLRRFRDLSMR